MTRAALTELAELQRWFSEVLRAPLDASSLTLAVAPDAWPAEAERLTSDGAHGTVRDRLAVYNRQYWFRLFTTFGREFPLLARVLGHYRLNQLAQRYLLARPPRGADLGRACDGFDAFVAAELDRGDVAVTPPLPVGLPIDALRDALAIDAAFRALWIAPRVPPIRPSPSDAARLPASRLVPSPAVAYVDEGWPLLELRRTLAAHPGDGAVPLPAPHAARRDVALLRVAGGVAEAPLEPLQARLYRELARAPLADALDRLAAAAPSSRADALEGDVRRWLAWGVGAGLWIGLADPG